MHTKRNVVLFVLGGLAAGAAVSFAAAKLSPKYTAEAFVKVVTVGEEEAVGPGFSHLAPVARREARVGVARLMKHQATLEAVVDSMAVQQTRWFQAFAGGTDERTAKAGKNLKRHLSVKPLWRGDLVRVSMCCRDKSDAATIVNEVIECFAAREAARARERVTGRLAHLEGQRVRVDRDLALAERAMEDVQTRYGLTDLEEHPYPSATMERIMRLEQQRDDCTLEMVQVKGRIEKAKSSAEGQAGNISVAAQPDAVKDANAAYGSLEARLAKLEEMLQEAHIREHEIESARLQYRQRAAARDERRRVLNAIQQGIETLKMIHDDPEISGLQRVVGTAEPLSPDAPKWGSYAVVGGLIGLAVGVAAGKSGMRTQKV